MRALSLLGPTLLGLPVLLACGPEPVYDETLGVEAVPVREGELAGTFALKTNSLTVEPTPLGEQDGGGTNLRLVVREWSEADGVYLQRSRLCGGVNFEVAGLSQHLPIESFEKVPESTEEIVEVDHRRGTYGSTGHLQLWGLRDLPDPFSTPLPETRDEAASEPHASRIFDMDEDGDPAVTIYMSGIATGEVYGIFRKTVDLEGVTLGPDHMIGLSSLHKEALQLGADNELLDLGSTVGWNHPDKKESWFEEVRLDEGATCADVRAAEDDGRLSRMRPF
jgi:hypothetical protein